MTRFAVLDLETTGISPAHNHRIVEIAIVTCDQDGCEIESWSTLVNPMRDIGAIEIHGISARDVFKAPRFNQIAWKVVELLEDSVIVAHNLPFDFGFVSDEIRRSGGSFTNIKGAGICTMSLAKHYISSRGRSLEDCCDAIGYANLGRHSALDDARAAGKLLQYYMSSDQNFIEEWNENIKASESIQWPKFPVTEFIPIERSLSPRGGGQHFLSRLVSKAPRDDIYPAANNYLAVIDRVLIDRNISQHEEEELLATAEMIGLSREDAMNCHRRYINLLVNLAKSDGVVTQEEMADIKLVAGLLGLDGSDVDNALAQDSITEPNDEERFSPDNFKVRNGDSIVITGALDGFDRGVLEARTLDAGLRLVGGVSRKTRLLVAGDPDSQSTKSRKARELKIPIVSFASYQKMLDELGGS